MGQGNIASPLERSKPASLSLWERVGVRVSKVRRDFWCVPKLSLWGKAGVRGRKPAPKAAQCEALQEAGAARESFASEEVLGGTRLFLLMGGAGGDHPR
jgi:hypothetical protein